MPTRPERPDPLLATRLRRVQYASDGAILFAVAVLAFAVRHWAWGPAVVGVLVVLATAAGNAAVFRVGVTLLKPGEQELHRAETHRRRRNTAIIYPGYATFAIALGGIAGVARSYWPDVIVGAIGLVTNLLPFALLPRLRRRAALEHHTQSDQDSGTSSA